MQLTQLPVSKVIKVAKPPQKQFSGHEQGEQSQRLPSLKNKGNYAIEYSVSKD
jgi:hypothetical protein